MTLQIQVVVLDVLSHPVMAVGVVLKVDDCGTLVIVMGSVIDLVGKASLES